MTKETPTILLSLAITNHDFTEASRLSAKHVDGVGVHLLQTPITDEEIVRVCGELLRQARAGGMLASLDNKDMCFVAGWLSTSPGEREVQA